MLEKSTIYRSRTFISSGKFKFPDSRIEIEWIKLKRALLKEFLEGVQFGFAFHEFTFYFSAYL